YYGYNSQVRQNNIFHGNTYGWYKYYGDAIPTTSNYNCFNSNGTNPIYHNSYGAITLATWRSYSSRDLNSIQADPQVVSLTDMHLKTGSPCRDSGLFLAGHGLDFEGDLRDTTSPDIGADEWRYPGDPLSGVYTIKQPPDTTGDFQSFNHALAALGLRGQSGDVTFCVYEGTYNENIVLYSPSNGQYRVVFQGTDTSGTPTGATLAASGTYAVAMRDAKRFEFRHLTITSTSYAFYWHYSGSSPYNGIDSCVVEDCDITGTYGFYIYYGDHNNRIERNIIRATSSYGIYLYGSSAGYSSNNIIANNMILGFTSYGIYSYYHTGTKYYYNTMYGTASYGFRNAYGTGFDMRNNILYAGTYAYYHYYGDNVPTTSDHNCFYTGTATPIYHNAGGALDLAGWRTYSGKDANSISANPLFISSSDLHLQDSSPCVGAGTPITGFPTDIDGDARSATAPTIGADEISGDIAVTGILTPTGMLQSGVGFTPQAAVAHVSGAGATVRLTMEIRKAGSLVYTGLSEYTALGAGDADTLDISPRCTLFLAGDDYSATCWHSNTPDLEPANDTASVTFEVGNVDMAMLAITAPTAQVPAGTLVYPQVRVANLGDFPANATINFVIDDLSDGGSEAVGVGQAPPMSAGIPAGGVAGIEPAARQADGPDAALGDAVVYSAMMSSGTIAPGDTALVTFVVSWTAEPAANYQARAWHLLEFDTDPANDSAELDFTVSQADADAGVAQIIQPGTFVDTNATFTPTARWRNYNTSDPVSFTAFFEIESPTLGWFYAEQVAVSGLGPGMDTVLSFTDVSVGMDTGNWSLRCSTFVGGDINPANDVARRAFVVAARPPFDEGWVEVKPMPLAPSGKAARRGAWLALNPGDGMIYATKGYKTQDFYRYDPIADTWTELACAPADPVKGRPLEKGCRGITDGDNTIYMVHGNNTVAFWKYD
ncbi:MAG: right-handed parallel beta-helix repeat-containing protein, partial [bacterium]